MSSLSRVTEWVLPPPERGQPRLQQWQQRDDLLHRHGEECQVLRPGLHPLHPRYDVSRIKCWVNIVTVWFRAGDELQSPVASARPLLWPGAGLPRGWREAGPLSLQSEVHPQVWPAIREVSSDLWPRLSGAWRDFILPWQRRGNLGVSRCRPLFVLPRIQSKVKQLTQKNDNCIPRLPGNGPLLWFSQLAPAEPWQLKPNNLNRKKGGAPAKRRPGHETKAWEISDCGIKVSQFWQISDKLWKQNNYSPIIFNNRDRDHHMPPMTWGQNTKYHDWELDHAITQNPTQLWKQSNFVQTKTKL